MSTLYNTGYFNPRQDIWIRSDLRDKRNVRPYSLSTADEVLRAIGGGIRYQLGAEDEFTVGLAAQVVQKHLPEAVRLILNEKKQERLTLRESAMVGVLVSGYNHQAAEIDELKKVVAKLLEENHRGRYLLHILRHYIFESTCVENTIAITPNMSPIQHGEQSPSTVPTIDNTKLLSGLTGLAKSSKLLA